MGVFKMAFEILLLILGLAVFADSASIITDMKDLAVKEAHPHKYLLLRNWADALTQPANKFSGLGNGQGSKF